MQRGQLPLFTRQVLPSRPVPRWSRKLDEVRICTRCGREIVTRRIQQDKVLSEFVSAAGECWKCAQAACR